MRPSKFDNYNVTLANAVNWTLLFSGILVFLVYFSSLLQPLVVGLLIWYLIRMLNNYIKRLKFKGKSMPHWLRNFLSIVIISLLFFFIGDLLISSLEAIIRRLPEYEEAQKRLTNEILSKLNTEEVTERFNKWLENIELRPILTTLVNSLSSLVGNVGIVIIYLIFILLEEKSFGKKVEIISSNSTNGGSTKKMFKKMDKAISDYLNIKTVVSLFTAILSYVVLIIFNIDFPVLWAFIIFLLNYIPYVGSLVATVLPALFAIVQTGSLMKFVYVFAGVEAVQLLMGNYVEPKITGKGLNLSPLVVLISLSFWGAIWGILGMILSVPISSILIIVLAQFPQTKNIAIFLSETGHIENFIIQDEHVEKVNP